MCITTQEGSSCPQQVAESSALLAYEAFPCTEGIMYLAIDGFGDIQSYIFHDPANERGLGGRTIDLPMIDGSVSSVKGPWSSNREAAEEVLLQARLEDNSLRDLVEAMERNCL